MTQTRSSSFIQVSALAGVAVLSAAIALAVRLGIESRISTDRSRFLLAHVQEHEDALERGATLLIQTLDPGAHKSANLQASRELGPVELIHFARRAHAEAAGYRRFGRVTEGILYELSATRSLIRFLEFHSARPEVPEALYLLGEAFSRLSQNYPVPLKSYSVLSLCMELYPDSIWAMRARMLWDEDRRDADRIRMIRNLPQPPTGAAAGSGAL